MGQRGKTGGCALAALALWLAGVPVGAQEGGPPTADKVAELFAQARPHLETVLGARLERPPQFRALSAEQMQQLPDPDLEACVRWQFPELQQDALARALEITRFASAGATLARHAEGFDVIYVVPDNLPRIANWERSLQSANAPAFLQLALVHEAARFALDQRYGLAARRATCRDREEFLAWLAVVEGRAQWVTSQVARRLGSQALFPLLAQRYLHVPDAAPDPALRTYSQTALRMRYWADVRGLAFFNVLQEKNLPDAEKRAFTRPPRVVRWIDRPDLYVRAEQSNRTDLATALRGLEQALPEAEWSAGQQAWTPAMVKQVAALLGERDRAERVTSTWDEGRTLVWSLRKDPRQMVAVSVVRHETPAGARSYFGFAVDLQRKQDQVVANCGPSIRVVESRATSVKLPGVEEAVRNDKRMQYGAGTEPVSVSTLLARAGDVVLECTWHGLPPETGWAERVLTAALAAVK